MTKVNQQYGYLIQDPDKTFIGFAEWLWSESLKTKDFIEKTPLAVKVSEWLLHQPQVRKFLEDVDESALIKPLRIGKTGFLVLPKAEQYQSLTGIQRYENSAGNAFQHRIPVKITGIEDSHIRLERTDGKDFSEIAYKFPYFPIPRSKMVAEFPAARIILVDQDKYQTYLRWIAYAVTKGAQENQSKIPAYFGKFWTTSESGLRRSLANPGIMSQLRTTDLPPDHFAKTSALPNVNKDHRGGKGNAGRDVITFPNGFKWVSLDRESCREEGDAGGHCGNTAQPRPGDNVLSLRDKDGRVYLTFVINDGVMGEMKANGNRKPPADLHPYIIKLLEDPMVKKIGEARWLPENNFQITDLDHENLIQLSKKRPDLTNIDKFDMLLIKNRNNMGRFLKHLHEKYPQISNLNVVDYDFTKQAFRISSGEMLTGFQGPEWHSTVWSSINDDIKSNLSVIREHFNDIPTDVLVEFSKYFLDHIDQINVYEKTKVIEELKTPKKLTGEVFEMVASRLMNVDKNLKHVFDNTYREAYRETAVDEINKQLRRNANGSGVFYQVKTGKFNEIIASKYIAKRNLRKIIKNPNIEPETEVEEVNLKHINVRPRHDIYMHQLTKNIKFLHYKAY